MSNQYCSQEISMMNQYFTSKIAIWNCSGIDNYSTQNWLIKVIIKDNVEYVGLIEPIINQEKADNISKELGMIFH